MSNSVPWHPGAFGYAGTVHDWYPSDTQESFVRMMQDPNHRAYFQAKGWDKPGSITYRFNSAGFRGEDFDPDSDNLVTLGCSFTMGVGLPESDVWPYLLASALDLRACNIAWGGASADTCFRMARYWVPYLRPHLVVMCTPPANRFEVVIDDNTGKALGYMPCQIEQEDQFIKHYLVNSTNSVINHHKNELAVWALCNQLNIPCLIYDSMVAFGDSREKLEYARDHMHAGPAGHRQFTDRILSDWQKNNLRPIPWRSE
jgi:hypothetical protein